MNLDRGDIAYSLRYGNSTRDEKERQPETKTYKERTNYRGQTVYNFDEPVNFHVQVNFYMPRYPPPPRPYNGDNIEANFAFWSSTEDKSIKSEVGQHSGNCNNCGGSTQPMGGICLFI